MPSDAAYIVGSIVGSAIVGAAVGGCLLAAAHVVADATTNFQPSIETAAQGLATIGRSTTTLSTKTLWEHVFGVSRCVPPRPAHGLRPTVPLDRRRRCCRRRRRPRLLCCRRGCLRQSTLSHCL